VNSTTPHSNWLKHHDTFASDAAARAQTYIDDREPAVTGEEGHKQLFKTTCALVAGFKLPLKITWPLLLEYNTGCLPPWTKSELIHKVCDAYRLVGVQYSEVDLMNQLNFETGATTSDVVEEIAPKAAKPIPRAKPDRAGFGPGTPEQLKRLAVLRGISVKGLCWAQERGVLVFGFFAGFEVFGVTDISGAILEIRRLDGKNFPAVGTLSERKSHAVRGSYKRHPVGISEAKNCSHIIVAEGVPDFLAAHDLILRELADAARSAPLRCAPVALLSANVAIDDAALPTFKGKFVRIFYHNDVSGAGWNGARRWQQQIVKAGAFSCDFFHFKKLTGSAVNDLNNYIVALAAGRISSDQPALRDFYS